MNSTLIAGHLGADPETRYTSGGQKVITFSVATNSKRGGKDITTWWRVTIWGDRFDKMLPYLKKGSAIIVIGELRAEIYTSKNGQPQVSLEITAESLKFSPFGRPDRGGEHGAYGSHGQSQGHSQGPSELEGIGYGSNLGNVHGSALGNSPSFGASEASYGYAAPQSSYEPSPSAAGFAIPGLSPAAFGQGPQRQSADEEEPPF